MMPYISGTDLLPTLISDFPDIPVMIMTASDDLETAIECLKMGAFDYLLKPVEPNQLTSAINKAMELNSMREAIARQNALLTGINSIFKEAFSSETEEEIAEASLKVAVELTGSSFGIIGEFGPNGLLNVIASSETGRNDCDMCDRTGSRRLPESLQIHGLYGRVLGDNKSFFTNDPVSRPDSISLTERHFPLTAFLCVPLKSGGKSIGLVAVGNRAGGYRDEELEALESLAPSIVESLLHKQAEDALKKLNEELEERVAQRTAELRLKDHILLSQSRQAAMGEMIGNIAHQWRQPLNVLGLTTQRILLSYDLGEFSREFLKKSVLQSMDLINHMSQTIDDFRNYFRPDKEKIAFKVHETMTNTLSLIEDSLKDDQIGIEIFATDDPVIHGYRNEFAQVLLNILKNARDALTERGTDNPRVTITICSEDSRAVVIISDNAGGIPEEIIDKIFDPYFTTKGQQAGTGVGLFMSKAIIEKNMGGRLTARNTRNGAEFRIEV
jgi:signal transduction histidine kinase